MQLSTSFLPLSLSTCTSWRQSQTHHAHKVGEERKRERRGGGGERLHLYKRCSRRSLNLPFTLWAKDRRSLAEVLRSDPIPSTPSSLGGQKSIERVLDIGYSAIPIAQISITDGRAANKRKREKRKKGGQGYPKACLRGCVFLEGDGRKRRRRGRRSGLESQQWCKVCELLICDCHGM